MLYQKLLSGGTPYFLDISECYTFEAHCHPEIELNYCINGAYTIVIDNKEYVLSQGDLAIVNPMVPHELRRHNKDNCLRLTIEVGPVLLGEQFSQFVSMNPRSNVFHLNEQGKIPIYKELTTLFDEMADILTGKPPFYNLTAQGNIYKISAVLLKLLTKNSNQSQTVAKSLIDVEKIGRAINLIYSGYDQQLTLDEVSCLCGYSKSNFCKIFKDITGESFHAMLNRHRIDVSCLMLKELNDSIEDIALSVGFADTKSFCRVFKKLKNISAGEYRKRVR